MNENKNAPTIVRRRRKMIRQQREKTPEPTKLSGGKFQCSDDESSSTTDQNIMANPIITTIPLSSSSSSTNTVPNLSETGTGIKQKPKSLSFSAHRSKILNKRDKGVGTSIVRSQSTPRDENKMISISKGDYSVNDNINKNIKNNNSAGKLDIDMKPVKRSLSSPRNKEDPRDDYHLQHHFQREIAPVREILSMQTPINLSERKNSIEKEIAINNNNNNNNNNDKISNYKEINKLTQLELNLRRFEEERQKFEMEKKKFEKEKREMDNRLRFKRFEDFERKRNQRRQLLDGINKVKNDDDSVDSDLYYDKERKNSLTLMPRKKFESSEEESLVDIYNQPQLQQQQLHQHQSPLQQQQQQQKKILNRLTKFDDYASLKKITNNEIDNNLEELIKLSVEPITGDLHDDYESSTAISSSSRDGDFEDDTIPLIEITPGDGCSSTSTNLINRKLRKSLSKSPDRRKHTIIKTDEVKPLTWFGRLFGGGKQSHKNNTKITTTEKPIDLLGIETKFSINRFLFIESRIIWRQLILDHPIEWIALRQMRNRCISHIIILIMYFGFGGMVFRFVEGAFENFYKCGVRRVKRDFVDHLWLSSHNLREDDWKSIARTKLRLFEEELHAAHEAGMTSYSGMKSWSFINGILYCMSVVTTIGYGHITPVTLTGRAITIVYAIIGIPMFLILLADFGKLFTRIIKFVWAYVRRLYYTGSIRKVRKQAQVQGVLRGMNMAYEIATFRRPSMMVAKPEPTDIEHASTTPQSTSTHLAPPSSNETPTTPMPPEIDIDDEFNLPISLAFTILLAYIFFGAAVYKIWENWTFFDSCYFVFVSMSTIGFGDLVPQHPIFMMASIIYLVFGLALTSMCINVVQVKLSDSFRQASAKIGATIGLSLAEEEARNSQNASPIDAVSVHSSTDSPNLTKRNANDNDNENDHNNINSNTNNKNSSSNSKNNNNNDYDNAKRKNSTLNITDENRNRT